jgi:RNA polymerase sigma-70 factor, ECF subfamily
VTGCHSVRTSPDTRGRSADAGGLEEVLEAHRRELRSHCRRILGSGFEAEDAVQETLVRAWCHIDGLERRSTMRSWLYRIATNVCLDMRRHPQRRARPVDPGQPSSVVVALPRDSEPAELAASHDAVRLALAVALQLLPPRQRAVLILRDVLLWRASEAAELLGTSVASVNSALQRARATLATVDRESIDPTAVSADERARLARCVDAFERYDLSSLVTLVRAT